MKFCLIIGTDVMATMPSLFWVMSLRQIMAFEHSIMNTPYPLLPDIQFYIITELLDF